MSAGSPTASKINMIFCDYSSQSRGICDVLVHLRGLVTMSLTFSPIRT